MKENMCNDLLLFDNNNMIMMIKIPFGSPLALLCYLAYNQQMQKQKHCF